MSRRFEIWLDKQVSGCETTTEIIEVEDGLTEPEIEAILQENLDVMISNEIDSGWRELVEPEPLSVSGEFRIGTVRHDLGRAQGQCAAQTARGHRCARWSTWRVTIERAVISEGPAPTAPATVEYRHAMLCGSHCKPGKFIILDKDNSGWTVNGRAK